MEYTIKKLAELSGVSTRTLRYYDEIELLKPARVNSSGYRIYGEKEVDYLQQILFYRSLDMKLNDIKDILEQPEFHFEKALESHYQELIQKQIHIKQLLLTVKKTLAYHKGEKRMSNNEKFTAFKEEKLKENKAMYGKEIRESYGVETIDASNKQWLNLSEAEFKRMNEAETQLLSALEEVIESKDLNSEAAQTVYTKHKEWLNFSWNEYSKDAHVGLANMYLADARFQAYYNEKVGDEATTVLCQIIEKYAV